MLGNKIKIFVTGFFNSGKTTLIHILDNKAISVEKELNIPYNENKTHTTTGFDLARLIWARPNLNHETNGLIMSKTEYLRDKVEYSGWHTMELELKGCPGQIQFASVRKILAKGSDGVIMLIDGCDLANIGNALVILEETKSCLGYNIPMRIIANKSDREDYNDIEMIKNLIGEEVYKGSAKNNIGIKDAIIVILKIILKGNSEKIVNENEVSVLDV
ncbi:MAG: GTP-binding protein [Candidatus Thorarchaeota archaeon]